MESLLDILKLGFRGYRHLAEFSPPSVKVIFRSLTSLVVLDRIVFTAPSRTRRGGAFGRTGNGSTMMIMR